MNKEDKKVVEQIEQHYAITYKGFHQLTLHELKDHLVVFSKIGCSGDLLEEIFAVKKIGWDIDHEYHRWANKF